MDTPIVLIRAYTPDDQKACREITSEYISDFTNPMFLQALFRETVYQLIVLVVALAFIFLGVPFKLTLLFIPVVLIAVYIGIRASNGVKSLEVGQEFGVVDRKYEAGRGGKLFVAELCESSGASFEQAAALMKSDEERKRAISSFFYLFEGHYNEASFYSKIQGSRRHVIGLVGVQPHERDGRRGFVRRLFLRRPYRSTVVVDKLLDGCVQHSRDFGFTTLDAVCSEVNEELREALFAKGFNISVTYHRYCLGLVAYMAMHTFSMALAASKSALEA